MDRSRATRIFDGRRVRYAAALSLVLAIVRAGNASELSDDLSARRGRLMERLGPETMLVLGSAPEVRYAADINYPFRQDSNLFYLTALEQPDTMLVLMPGNDTVREILFVKDRDPVAEHWNGRRISGDDATVRTGIRTVLPTSEFERFVTAMLNRQPYGAVDASRASRFFDALANGRAKLSVVLERGRRASDPLPAPLDFVKPSGDRFAGFTVTNADKVLTDLRLVKTPYERTLLVKAAEISVAAQLAGFAAARPGAFEYEVKAALEAVHYGRGAVPGYPSIVGSGPNSTILHYPDRTRQMQAGDLLLIDAAASVDYMAVDVTRTAPVGGAFSPVQADIYDVVLRAQQAGIDAARRGATLKDVHGRTADVVKAGLLKLGLITDPSTEQYRLWYTHDSSHYIGVDVHDVGDNTRPLEPGMAFTIEPGIYVRQAALDALPRTPQNLTFIERVQPAVRKYQDIGIRIEDSFLLGASGLENLSGALPKTIDGIEALMRRTR
jgi:Xaa-Pro aminopeptidase